MPNPGHKPGELQEAWDRLQQYGTQAAAARSYDPPMHPNTFKGRIVAYRAQRDMPEGQRAAIAAVRLDHGTVQGGWIKTKPDADGISHSVRWKAPEAEAEDYADAIRAALEGLTAATPVPAPTYADADLLTVYPIADAHIGMMSWGRETGEDYDTHIAVTRLQDWIGRCINASPASSHALILDVGDTTHADDQTNQTPRSKHVLDVDSRYFRTLDVTIAALARAVDTALERHLHVTLVILPGNHSPHSYMALMFALAERYRLEPRVTVHKEPGEYYVQEFGDIMLAAHHGDKAKAERLVMFMADEYAEIWGRTKHRFLWTGHLHHHKSADIGGVQWEQLRAMTARDSYAVSHAYSARAQLQAITLHRTAGEIQRVKVNA
jgi:hypothetical protein